MRARTPAQHLAHALGKYDPRVARLARAALSRMRRHVPGAVELVYDNYNALVIGFGPSEKASEAICSLAVYPRWVNLFFLHGATLPDPTRRLKGSGMRTRHVTLEQAGDLDAPEVVALIRASLAAAATRPDPGMRRRMVLRAVAAKQRARRNA
jgi:hypothetical protein